MWTREEGEIAPLAGMPAAGEVTAAAAELAMTAAAVVIADGRGAEACGTTAPILAVRGSARTAWRRKNLSRICLRT